MTPHLSLDELVEPSPVSGTVSLAECVAASRRALESGGSNGPPTGATEEHLDDLAWYGIKEWVHSGGENRIPVGEDPHDWMGAIHRGREDAALSALVKAGEDPEDPDVEDAAIAAAERYNELEGSQWEDDREGAHAREAIAAPPRPVTPWSTTASSTRFLAQTAPVQRHEGRHRRASRSAPVRRRGSRRTTASSGSRGDPDDLAEPPAHSWLLIGGRR